MKKGSGEGGREGERERESSSTSLNPLANFHVDIFSLTVMRLFSRCLMSLAWSMMTRFVVITLCCLGVVLMSDHLCWYSFMTFNLVV